MNDEIKEILELKEDCDYKRISVDEILVLRDYITNLQEENKELEAKLEMYENGVYFSSENDELQQRIDKAIEYLTDEGVCILNKGMKENEQLVWTWENYYELLDILQGIDENE